MFKKPNLKLFSAKLYYFLGTSASVLSIKVCGDRQSVVDVGSAEKCQSSCAESGLPTRGSHEAAIFS